MGELLGFMKKYRLVFAEGDEDPAVGATYRMLDHLPKRERVALDFAEDAGRAGGEGRPVDRIPTVGRRSRTRQRWGR